MRLILLLGTFFSVLNSIAQDTTFYENGSIQYISNKYKSFSQFHVNGQLIRKTTYGKFMNRGHQENYDSLGRLISKGGIFDSHIKHGKWKYYEQGKRISKHHFKFGMDSRELKTIEGKRMKLILQYGKPMFQRPCSESEEKYRVKFIRIAGCLVNNNIVWKASSHNFFTKIPLTIRYGFNWHDKIMEVCRNRNSDGN